MCIIETAGEAHEEEQPLCKRKAAGSNPATGSDEDEIEWRYYRKVLLKMFAIFIYRSVAEWSIAGDCKSPAFGLRWFKSNLADNPLLSKTNNIWAILLAFL